MTNNYSLINPTLLKEFAKVGEQTEVADPIVVAKFFNPSGSGTWYAISCDPETNICFGYVADLMEDELGYFSVSELEALRVPSFGLHIECDIYFKPCRLSEIKTGRAS